MMKEIPAGEFKTHCLRILDDVNEKRNTVIVTKRGVPVAKLVPIEKEKKKSAFGCMKGTFKILGNIVDPIEDVKWEANDDNIGWEPDEN